MCYFIDCQLSRLHAAKTHFPWLCDWKIGFFQKFDYPAGTWNDQSNPCRLKFVHTIVEALWYASRVGSRCYR